MENFINLLYKYMNQTIDIFEFQEKLYVDFELNEKFIIKDKTLEIEINRLFDLDSVVH